MDSGKHVNLTAYDDVESLNNFTSQSFEKYCHDKLKTCDKHIALIQKNCQLDTQQWKGNVTEIGSGNGKLLYRMEKEGMLEKGVGIEISQSRHTFAQAFKDFVKSNNVVNVCDDMFNVSQPQQQDLVVAVDVVMQLIAPIAANAEQRFLNWCHDVLKDKGYLLLELWDFEHIAKQLVLSDEVLQLWEEFPSSDPFEFCLAKLFYDEQRDIVWQKNFLKRDSQERSTFTNILRPYSRARITELLEKSGFGHVTIFENWGEQYESAPGEYVVLAQKSLA